MQVFACFSQKPPHLRHRRGENLSVESYNEPHPRVFFSTLEDLNNLLQSVLSPFFALELLVSAPVERLGGCLSEQSHPHPWEQAAPHVISEAPHSQAVN